MTGSVRKGARHCSTYLQNAVAAIPFWHLLRMYVLKHPRIAPAFKSAFGSRLHQKLLAYPVLGYWPQIAEPRTFNERIMHRQLFTDDPLFTLVEDKVAARRYVRDLVGSGILSDVYHVTDDPETIPFDALPGEYVIKPSHLSGPVRLVDSDDRIDREQVRSRCRDWLSQTHGRVNEQYWYADIPPRIMIEERLRDDEYEPPLDYKFYVFHGRVEYVHVDFNRFDGGRRRFFDREWNPQDFRKGGIPLGPSIDEPTRYEEMREIAEQLGTDFDFIRVDLYLLNNERIVFGELTVGPSHGRSPFDPERYDFVFGELWDNPGRTGRTAFGAAEE